MSGSTEAPPFGVGHGYRSRSEDQLMATSSTGPVSTVTAPILHARDELETVRDRHSQGFHLKDDTGPPAGISGRGVRRVHRKFIPRQPQIRTNHQPGRGPWALVARLRAGEKAMSTVTDTLPSVNEQNGSSPRDTATRDLHVKGVPEDAWYRARQNALQSRLPFKTYIIRLLMESGPFPLAGD